MSVKRIRSFNEKTCYCSSCKVECNSTPGATHRKCSDKGNKGKWLEGSVPGAEPVAVAS